MSSQRGQSDGRCTQTTTSTTTLPGSVQHLHIFDPNSTRYTRGLHCGGCVDKSACPVTPREGHSYDTCIRVYFRASPRDREGVASMITRHGGPTHDIYPCKTIFDENVRQAAFALFLIPLRKKKRTAAGAVDGTKNKTKQIHRGTKTPLSPP